MDSNGFTQVGTMALRHPVSGEVLRSVPLFVRDRDVPQCQAPEVSDEPFSRSLVDGFSKYVTESKKSRG